jgi:outer membrane lipoprotein carrier protein lolA
MKILYAAAAFLLWLPAANAAVPTSSDIGKIENYLNSVKTLTARFVQNASNGNVAEGKLWIEKPNKIRMEYGAPTNVLIVGNGDFIVYHDKDLDQVSNIDYEDIPASLILGNDIRIDGKNIKITDFYQDSGTTIATLEYAKGGIGPITLVFNNQPFELRQWKIVDPQSVEVTVSLYGSKTDEKLPASLFRFRKQNNPLNNKKGR